MKETPKLASRRLLPWLPLPKALGPLARRMTAVMAMLMVGVILSMLWLSHARVEDAVSESELTRIQASADQLGTTLHTQARRLMQDAARIAAIPVVRNAATGATPRLTDSVAEVFKSQRTAQVSTIALWSSDGRLMASTGSDASASRPDTLRLESTSVPSVGPLILVRDTVTYSITAPITNLSGKPIGYVVVTRQLLGGGASAALMGGLVGRDARVLLGNAEGGFMTDLSNAIPAQPERPVAGTARRYHDTDGTPVLGASAAVPETPWLVLVEAPAAVAMRAVSRFTLESAIFGSAFVLVGAFLSWLLIRRTMQPLGEVTSAAREITGGDLSRRVSVEGTDEIAILGEAFNQMIDRVERSSADLESRAEQLQATNKDLNESEAKYRGLFEHMPDGILVHCNNRILFANPAAIRLLGAETEAELSDRPLLDQIESADRSLVNGRVDVMVAESRPVPTVEVRLRRADRKLVTVEATSMPLSINGCPAIQTILHDVTERRLLEEQFRQSQKMDAVGRLAGGVAHDFNNLLTVIQAHAEFALAEGESEEARRADIEEIRKTAHNAARLTRQLLTFSRKEALTPAHIDLNDAIAGMLGMVQRLIGDNIEVVTVNGCDLAGIWADPGQIQQVLLNLAVNARDAMPDGGVLRFETANISVGEGYVGAASAIPPGDYVMLAVQDTGIGMTEEIRSRVFEPFFTTKQVGRGTGLGLSTVYGIVKQSQGHIWVYSEPGMGTAFKVFFPPYRGDEFVDAAPAAERQIGTDERGHLLVVEDDASVRAAVVRTLRNAGYTITEAQHAGEAIAAISADPTIELMITDMVMPGKPGVELLADVRALRTRLPAIVLSGYSEQSTPDAWRVPEHAVFVEKPVSPAELIRRVKQLLAART